MITRTNGGLARAQRIGAALRTGDPVVPGASIPWLQEKKGDHYRRSRGTSSLSNTPPTVARSNRRRTGRLRRDDRARPGEHMVLVLLGTQEHIGRSARYRRPVLQTCALDSSRRRLARITRSGRRLARSTRSSLRVQCLARPIEFCLRSLNLPAQLTDLTDDG